MTCRAAGGRLGRKDQDVMRWLPGVAPAERWRDRCSVDVAEPACCHPVMNDFRMPAMPQMPRIPDLKMPDPPAKRAHYGLVERIQWFESRLGDDEEMSVYLPTMPVAFRLTGIGDMGELIFFYGEDPDGRRVEAYQHHTQTNITLIASAKPEGIEARRMGFETPPVSE